MALAAVMRGMADSHMKSGDRRPRSTTLSKDYLFFKRRYTAIIETPAPSRMNYFKRMREWNSRMACQAPYYSLARFAAAAQCQGCTGTAAGARRNPQPQLSKTRSAQFREKIGGLHFPQPSDSEHFSQ
jgi:hypothetical protein